MTTQLPSLSPAHVRRGAAAASCVAFVLLAALWCVYASGCDDIAFDAPERGDELSTASSSLAAVKHVDSSLPETETPPPSGKDQYGDYRDR